MNILKEPIALKALKAIATENFGDMVKAVVDVKRQLLAINAELHSDLESLLLENGSTQKDLWGINLYPDLEADTFIEFDSLINVRPSQKNMGRGVDDEATRKEIIKAVNKWIVK